MSTRAQHRTRFTGAVLAATVGLVVTTGSLASADPPALNKNPCSTTLLQAASWPGVMSDGTRLVSDGFVTHLSRQAPCESVLARP